MFGHLTIDPQTFSGVDERKEETQTFMTCSLLLRDMSVSTIHSMVRLPAYGTT